MNDVLVAIAGQVKSGKSTVEKKLHETLKPQVLDVTSIGFADAVKEVARTLYPRHDFVTQQGKEAVVHGTEMTGRDVLVMVGDGLRVYDPDIWVRKLVSRLDAYVTVARNCRGNSVYVVPDMRYDNEYLALSEWCKRSDTVFLPIYLISEDPKSVLNLYGRCPYSTAKSENGLSYNPQLHYDSWMSGIDPRKPLIPVLNCYQTDMLTANKQIEGFSRFVVDTTMGRGSNHLGWMCQSFITWTQHHDKCGADHANIA